MNGLQVLTPWGAPADADHQPLVPADPRRHDLFQQLACETMDLQYPWLRRLLQATGARVLAMQGGFFVALSPRREDWIEVPELSAQLWLMPWCEDGETAQ